MLDNSLDESDKKKTGYHHYQYEEGSAIRCERDEDSIVVDLRVMKRLLLSYII